jgi:hypothetical protein
LLAGAAALAVAAETKVGPVVHRFSQGHGIHLGDVVFSVAAVVACALVTRSRWR